MTTSGSYGQSGQGGPDDWGAWDDDQEHLPPHEQILQNCVLRVAQRGGGFFEAVMTGRAVFSQLADISMKLGAIGEKVENNIEAYIDSAGSLPSVSWQPADGVTISVENDQVVIIVSVTAATQESWLELASETAQALDQHSVTVACAGDCVIPILKNNSLAFHLARIVGFSKVMAIPAAPVAPYDNWPFYFDYGSESRYVGQFKNVTDWLIEAAAEWGDGVTVPVLVMHTKEVLKGKHVADPSSDWGKISVTVDYDEPAVHYMLKIDTAAFEARNARARSDGRTDRIVFGDLVLVGVDDTYHPVAQILFLRAIGSYQEGGGERVHSALDSTWSLWVDVAGTRVELGPWSELAQSLVDGCRRLDAEHLAIELFKQIEHLCQTGDHGDTMKPVTESGVAVYVDHAKRDIYCVLLIDGKALEDANERASSAGATSTADFAGIRMIGFDVGFHPPVQAVLLEGVGDVEQTDLTARDVDEALTALDGTWATWLELHGARTQLGPWSETAHWLLDACRQRNAEDHALLLIEHVEYLCKRRQPGDTMMNVVDDIAVFIDNNAQDIYLVVLVDNAALDAANERATAAGEKNAVEWGGITMVGYLTGYHPTLPSALLESVGEVRSID